MTPRGRVFRHWLPFCALGALSLAARPQPEWPSFQDLAPEFAARIAAAVAPLQQIRLRPLADPADGDRSSMHRDLIRELSTRGVTVTEPLGRALVSYACAANVRARICAADIQKDGDGARTSVIVERWHETHDAPLPGTPVVISVQPLFAERAAILDVASVGPRLLALDPSGISVYERTNGGWRRTTSRPVAASHPWPRDMRGRLRIEGSTVEAFLPGVTCDGVVDPLSVTCRDEVRPWPLGIDNGGLAAGQNRFALPAGLAFVSVAPLGADAAARWLVTLDDDRVEFLDAAQRTVTSMGAVPRLTNPPAADAPIEDVAAVATPCLSGTHVVAASRDTLRLFQVSEQRFTLRAPPVTMPGPITALWPTGDGTRALVVSRAADSDLYEAFLATIVCGR